MLSWQNYVSLVTSQSATICEMRKPVLLDNRCLTYRKNLFYHTFGRALMNNASLIFNRIGHYYRHTKIS